MYRKKDPQIHMNEYIPSFSGTLNPNNRWVQMAELIPWEEFEDEYASKFGKTGNVAYPLRMALGTLIIKEKKNTSNEETIQEIVESRYLQYFIGLHDFTNDAPFDQSAVTRFAQRLGSDIVQRVNQRICEIAQEKNNNNDQGGSSNNTGSKDDVNKTVNKNVGKIILDATCAPSDIRYPTDVSLLNQAREKLESMIDTLHKPMRGKQAKPRTYRKTARKDYLSWAKKRKKRGWKVAVRKQLGYVGRDLRSIDEMLQMEGLGTLTRRQLKDLATIQMLFEQQETMHKEHTHQIDNRIVSIQQPYIRPIKRGKIHADTEFGAKVSISVIKGYAYIDRISWDNYSEAQDLIDVAEKYKFQYGYYPEVIQGDQIYRNRKNRDYCKTKGIRLSGPPLGRPPKDKIRTKEQRWLEYQDSCERNAVEGKFGEAKRCGTLGQITARLQATCETQISMVFLVRNLQKALRDLLRLLLLLVFGKHSESFELCIMAS